MSNGIRRKRNCSHELKLSLSGLTSLPSAAPLGLTPTWAGFWKASPCLPWDFTSGMPRAACTSSHGSGTPKEELVLCSEDSKGKIQLLSPGFWQIQPHRPSSLWPSLRAHIWAAPAEGSQELRELLLGNCSGALAGGAPTAQGTGWHQALAPGFGHSIPAQEVAI